MKIVTVLGTRPEIIRLSRLIPLLDQFTDHVLVHTGQNYDPGLSKVFFEDLGLRPPNHYLGIQTDSLGAALGSLLPSIEEVLRAESPDAVTILGDTNSALAAVISERLGFPVFHMEAGNRSFDRAVPEELNRRIVDHVSTYNLPYTEHARRNLIREGLDEMHICMTGSPMKEVLSFYKDRVDGSDVLQKLGVSRGSFVLASLHRQENVDSPEILSRNLLEFEVAANALKMPVVLTLHPRTLSKIEMFGIQVGKRILPVAPLGFFDYVSLQSSSYCVISDSGSIGEEASILRFPAVTIRRATERPEALEAGWISKAEPGLSLLPFIEAAVSGRERRETIPEYEVADFSLRVLNFILSNTPPSVNNLS